MKRMDKKGQQMTLGTIIAIVLGIAVLVFLIFGFSSGWNNMWSKVTQYGGGSGNVDDVIRGCEIACTGQNTNAYCEQSRTADLGNGTSESGACNELKKKIGINIVECPSLCAAK